MVALCHALRNKTRAATGAITLLLSVAMVRLRTFPRRRRESRQSQTDRRDGHIKMTASSYDCFIGTKEEVFTSPTLQPVEVSPTQTTVIALVVRWRIALDPGHVKPCCRDSINSGSQSTTTVIISQKLIDDDEVKIHDPDRIRLSWPDPIMTGSARTELAVAIEGRSYQNSVLAGMMEPEGCPPSWPAKQNPETS